MYIKYNQINLSKFSNNIKRIDIFLKFLLKYFIKLIKIVRKMIIKEYESINKKIFRLNMQKDFESNDIK